jgi:hypothetical protein
MGFSEVRVAGYFCGHPRSVVTIGSALGLALPFLEFLDDTCFSASSVDHSEASTREVA